MANFDESSPSNGGAPAKHQNVEAPSSGGTAGTQQSVSISSLAAFLDGKLQTGSGPGSKQIPYLWRFDSSQVPEISVYDYLARLKAYTKSDTSLLMAIIYIDRLLASDSNFTLTHLNVHRLFLTCATVAEKYINDIPYVNTHYATFGGVSLDELNRLEVILLYGLKWRLGVSPEEYDKKTGGSTTCVYGGLMCFRGH
jgi:hypothetical protein